MFVLQSHKLQVFHNIHVWFSRQASSSRNVTGNLGIPGPLSKRVHSCVPCNQLDNDAFSATLNFSSSPADLIAHNPKRCGRDHATQPRCGPDLLRLCTPPPSVQSVAMQTRRLASCHASPLKRVIISHKHGLWCNGGCGLLLGKNDKKETLTCSWAAGKLTSATISVQGCSTCRRGLSSRK